MEFEAAGRLSFIGISLAECMRPFFTDNSHKNEKTCFNT